MEKHLSRFVEGQDPRDVELMWDQMYRSVHVLIHKPALVLLSYVVVRPAVSSGCGAGLLNPPPGLPSTMAAKVCQSKPSALWTWRSGTFWVRSAKSQCMPSSVARPRTACPCTAPQVDAPFPVDTRLTRASARPDLAKEMGFCGAKIPCPYGPSAGQEGFNKNVEFFKGWREKVGPDFPLSLDCYMSLTVPYSIRVSSLAGFL